MKIRNIIWICALTLSTVFSLCGCSKGTDILSKTATDNEKEENMDNETVINVNIESKDSSQVKENEGLDFENKDKDSSNITALDDPALIKELLDNAKNMDNVTQETYYEFLIRILDQDSIEGSSFGNISFEMPDVNVCMIVKSDITPEVVHSTGKAKMPMIFASATMDINSYDDVKNGYTYSPFMYNGEQRWKKSPYEGEDERTTFYKSTIEDVADVSLFEDSECYILKGIIPQSTESFDFINLNGMWQDDDIDFEDDGIENKNAENNETDKDNAVFDESCYVEFKFDKDTKNLVSIIYDLSDFVKEYSVDSADGSSGAFSIETYNYEYRFSNHGNVAVEIPEDIVNNAKESDSDTVFEIDENFADSDWVEEQGWEKVTEPEEISWEILDDDTENTDDSLTE